MTEKQLLNEKLFKVVNLFTLDEFKRYTNFVDIIETLYSGSCTKREIELCVQLNFQNNVPRKSLWKLGAFRSLELNRRFYESDLARQIFEDIYGVKQCHVALKATSNEETVNCIAAAGMSSQLVDALKDTYPIISGMTKNILQEDSFEPDALKNCRNSFYDYMKHIEEQFEKYLADTDRNSVSFDDFWQEFTSAEYKNDSPKTLTAPIANDFKVEDPIQITDVVVESDSSNSDIVYVSFHRNDGDSVVEGLSTERTTMPTDTKTIDEQPDAPPPSPHESDVIIIDEQVHEIVDLTQSSEDDSQSCKRSSPVAVINVEPKKRRLSTCKVA